ncbi:unnamed protein product [Closterium sp. Naga37s-1]|nr:unnamed protein product [Closterium sp. Naga37s-1]
MEVADPLENFRDSFGNDCVVERRARKELEMSESYVVVSSEVKELQDRMAALVAAEHYEEACVVRDSLAMMEFRKRLLEIQAKPRIMYRVGDVIVHRRYGYRGVVYGHDPECSAPSSWQDAMKVDLLTHGRSQPFYHVLVDTRDRAGGVSTYVAQENLVAQSDASPVVHPWIPKFFVGFQDGTLVLKVAKRLPQHLVAGFYTVEAKAEGTGERLGLDVITFAGERAPLCRLRRGCGPKIGKYYVAIDEFERVVLPHLMPSDTTRLHIVDEIGRMELCSDKFRDAVLNLLASPVAVFGALPAPRYGHTLELVEEIKQRADTAVLTLTKANRDATAASRDATAVQVEELLLTYPSPPLFFPYPFPAHPDQGQQGRHSSADRGAAHTPLSRKGRSSEGGSDHALMPHAIPPYPPFSPSLIPPLSAVLTLIKANRDATAVQIEELLTRLIQEGGKSPYALMPHALPPYPSFPPYLISPHSAVLTLTGANRDATGVQIEELLTRLIQEGEKGAGEGANMPLCLMPSLHILPFPPHSSPPFQPRGRKGREGGAHALMPHAIPPYPPFSPSLIPPHSAVLTLTKANRDATAVQIEELLTRLIQEGEKGAGGALGEEGEGDGGVGGVGGLGGDGGGNEGEGESNIGVGGGGLGYGGVRGAGTGAANAVPAAAAGLETGAAGPALISGGSGAGMNHVLAAVQAHVANADLFDGSHTVHG